MSLCRLILLFALCCGAAHAAETSFEEWRTAFELFNSCQPMNLIVESLPPDAAEIGLTEHSLRIAAESRLRSARLYKEDAPEYLYLNTNVVGKAFNVTLEYKRPVCHWDTTKPENCNDHPYACHDFCGRAATWRTGGTGTHGKDAGYIRSVVSEYMDNFLLAYLKENEAACSN